MIAILIALILQIEPQVFPIERFNYQTISLNGNEFVVYQLEICNDTEISVPVTLYIDNFFIGDYNLELKQENNYCEVIIGITSKKDHALRFIIQYDSLIERSFIIKIYNNYLPIIRR